MKHTHKHTHANGVTHTHEHEHKRSTRFGCMRLKAGVRHEHEHTETSPRKTLASTAGQRETEG